MQKGRVSARPFMRNVLSAIYIHMTGQVESWRVDHHAKEIERLRERLYEAEEKIRELERRPREWAFKAEMAILWLLIAAMWAVSIAEIAAKN